MPGQKVLIHAYPGTGLTESVNNFITHIREDPFGSWLILPTKRLIRTVQDQLTDSKISFLPFHICTADDMCSYLVDNYGGITTFIKPETSRLLLVELLKKHQDELTLFFAEKNPSPRVIHDLQILIQVLIRREIDYPACLGSLQSEKSRQISFLISTYQNTLLEKNLVDKDTRLFWVIKNLQEKENTILRSVIRHVHVFGLFEPLPLEKRLLRTLGEVSETLHYTVPVGKDQRIFSDTCDWLSHTSEDLIPSDDIQKQLTTIFSNDPLINQTYLVFPHITRMGFSDPVTEMTEVAREISRLLQTGVQYEDIAIVSPDFRSTCGYAIEVCADFGIPLKPSQGPLLQTCPLISYYLSIFDLIEKGMRYEELVRVIQSPYCRYSWETEHYLEENIITDHETGKKPSGFRYLSYKYFDLLCRTYGLDSGHIDWEKRLPEILLLYNETNEKSLPVDGKETDSLKNQVRSSYVPKKTLGREKIEETIEGTIRFIGIFKKFRDKRTIREHIQHLKIVLNEIGSPVPGLAHENPLNIWLTDEEYLGLSSFDDLLNELMEISGSEIVSHLSPVVKISFIDFFSAIRHVLQEKTGKVQPDSAGVLFAGLREIAHQNYPYVFLISLNEGQIPRLTTRLPFSNSSENSRMDTRTISDILRQEKYQFIAVLASGTTHLYMSWYEHKDERTVLPSVFIDCLKSSTIISDWEGYNNDDIEKTSYLGDMEASFAAGTCIRTSEWEKSLTHIPSTLSLSSIVERISIERSYRFRLNRSEYDGYIGSDLLIKSALNSKFGSGYFWSASMLETYARCPFRFYLERVLNIRPLPEIGRDFPSEMKGNLIHTILSRFKRSMHGMDLLPVREAGFDAALSIMMDIAHEECDKVPYKTPLWHAKKKQILGGEGIGEGILERFIKAEIDRLSPDDGRIPHQFTPRYFEYSFGAIKGPDDDPDSTGNPVDLTLIRKEWKKVRNSDNYHSDTEGREEPVQFIGKIDRIDLTPDGLFGIIDYKTGKIIPGSSDLARMTALQLPLYLLAYQYISGKKPVFGSYIQLQRKIKHNIPLYDPSFKQTLPNGKLPRSDPGWHKILENVLECSITHVHDIIDGIFPIQARSDCNTDWYCPYKTICRFQPDRGSQLGEWYLYPPESDENSKEVEA